MFEVEEEEDEETHLPLIFILARVAGLNKHLSAENVLAQSTKNLRSQGFLFFTLFSFSPTLFLLPSRSLSLSLASFSPYLPVASLSFYFFSFLFSFSLFVFFRVFLKFLFIVKGKPISIRLVHFFARDDDLFTIIFYAQENFLPSFNYIFTFYIYSLHLFFHFFFFFEIIQFVANSFVSTHVFIKSIILA